MRHQKKRHRLGRDHAHRKATLTALSTALIEHKRITTTLPKAKALRNFVEPLISRAKDDTTHNRRQVFRYLQSKEAVKELFDEVGPLVGDRPGGYTRVIRLGRRPGDSAEVAVIEFVDYNDVRPEGGSSSKRRTRRGGGRSRRRSAKGEQSQTATQPSTKPDAAQTSAPQATAQVNEDEPQNVATSGTVPVEQPVADAQTEPVTERTEPQPPADQVEAAEDAIEQQETKAENDGGEEADDEKKA